MGNKIAKYYADDELPDLLEVAAGAAYMKEVHSKDAAYDRWQYKFWMQYLEGIALSRFEWHDLPEGIDPRAVEYILYYYGIAGLFIDNGGFLFAQASYGDGMNMYYNPNEVNLTSPAGGLWMRHAQSYAVRDGDELVICAPDVAICFDSLLRRPLYSMLKNYAIRLAEIDRIVQVNMGAQKTPWMIASGEGQQKTARRVVKKLENNDQYITYNAAGFDVGSAIQVLNTQAPYVSGDLLSDQQRILNQALSIMGVDNDPNAEKRERKVSLEVLQNNEQVMLARRNFQGARDMFSDACERVFGIRPYATWAARHEEEQPGLDALGGQGDPAGDASEEGASYVDY